MLRRAKALQAYFRIRAPCVAEQMFEHHARIVLRRQGCIGASPRDRVGVGTRKTGVAGARHVAGLDSQLERCQLRVLACLLREDLVHRNAGIEQRFTRRRRHVGQEPCGRFGMCPARPAGHRHAVEIAEYDSWFRNGASGAIVGMNSNAAPSAAGNQSFMIMPLGTYTAPKRLIGLGRGLHHGGQSRHHSVEQRQCDRNPKAAQHRATGYFFFVMIIGPVSSSVGDFRVNRRALDVSSEGSTIPMANGVLVTMDDTRDDHR